MSRLCYISRNYKTTAHGGGKARVDSEDILASMGAVNLGIGRSFHSNKAIDYTLTLSGIVHFMKSVRPGDIIVLQYPVKKYYRLICRWARKRGAKTITLIHDLGSFRRKRLTPDEEIAKLSLTDCIIAANANTAGWLKEHGCKVPIVEQGAWDFLSESRPSESKPSVSCAFVGNVSPKANGFLYKLDVPLYLYGSGGTKDANSDKQIEICGLIDSDQLLSNMKGSYGLVWYGSETDGGIARSGEYLSVNNPHKLALYIRAGKPVIIWSGAGSAPFVEEHNIGISVDSLDNLEAKLAAVSPEKYAVMHENAILMGRQMNKGHFLRTAVVKALNALGESAPE